MPISGGGAFPAEYTAARAVYLDNIAKALNELKYDQFWATLDDDPSIDTSYSDVTDPQLMLDNNLGTSPVWDTIAEYAELHFERPVYIKEFRWISSVAANGDGRWKIEAYINGVWVDRNTGLVPNAGAWGAWTALSTPTVATMWRITCTTVDTGTSFLIQGLELKGVPA